MSHTIIVNEKQAAFIASLAAVSARVQVEISRRKSSGLPMSSDFVDGMTSLMLKVFLLESFGLPPSATFSLMRQASVILQELRGGDLPPETTEGMTLALEQLAVLEDAAEKFEAFESLGIKYTPEDYGQESEG